MISLNDVARQALTVTGLAGFEGISSIDNAVVNADVLATMKNEKAKRFFLTWGLFAAVVLVRGLLPLAIFKLANPDIGIWQAMVAMSSGDPAVKAAVEASSPYLLVGGGMFLFLLCMHWLFMEEKEYGLPHEPFLFEKGSIWFYSVAAAVLPGSVVLFRHLFPADPNKVTHLILATTIGYAVFFVTEGFKRNAEETERRLVDAGGESSMSDWAKVVYLEVIDATFSFDGVIGAFAFTMNIPLIMIGNGIGALIVRELTIRNVEKIKQYAYLKNGAMYSIGFLGFVMMSEALGVHIPQWVSPIATFFFIAYFFWRSVKKNKLEGLMAPAKNFAE